MFLCSYFDSQKLHFLQQKSFPVQEAPISKFTQNPANSFISHNDRNNQSARSITDILSQCTVNLSASPFLPMKPLQ